MLPRSKVLQPQAPKYQNRQSGCRNSMEAPAVLGGLVITAAGRAATAKVDSTTPDLQLRPSCHRDIQVDGLVLRPYIYIYISFYRKTMYLFNVFNYLTIVCFPIQKPPVGFWVFQNTKIPMTFAGICCCQVGAKPCIVERTLSCWQWPSGPLGEWWEKHWRKNNRRMVRWWRKTSTFASCKWNPWKKCMQLILLCKVESLIHRSSWMFWMLLVSRKPKLTKLQADEIAFGAILAVEMGSWPVSLRLLEQMEDLEMRCDNCNLCWIGSS